jgi:peptidoglycan-associated lipoprotein
VKDLLSVDGSVQPEQRTALTPVEVRFEHDEAGLGDQARKRLDVVVEALRDELFNGITIIIEGHTDENGTATYNRRLGKKRAQAVKD